jgi:phosphoglycolate phosphatase-like HAD superfamily hydrolase
MHLIIRTCSVLVFSLIICLSYSVSSVTADPLPSWNDVASKNAIVDFVEAVTKKGTKHYVPPEDRIATFDNDGTLWVEKPLYTHLLGVVAYMKEQMQADPSLAEREPYRAVASKDLGYFMALFENTSFETLGSQLMGVPFGGMTHAQYNAWAKRFLSEFKHPKFKVGVEGLIYQPMVELINYLEANEFTVYIFTADEAAFLRLAATKLYGLPPSQIHGTSMRSEFVVENGKAVLVRSYRMHYLDNWAAKPRLIDQVIGKKPIFAAGNSNGDQHMLQYAALTGGMSVLVHHTDDTREYKYDKHTDKVIPLAKEEGWTVIDMKNDWKTIFP